MPRVELVLATCKRYTSPEGIACHVAWSHHWNVTTSAARFIRFREDWAVAHVELLSRTGRLGDERGGGRRWLRAITRARRRRARGGAAAVDFG